MSNGEIEYGINTIGNTLVRLSLDCPFDIDVDCTPSNDGEHEVHAVYVNGITVASWWGDADSALQRSNKFAFDRKIMEMLATELAEMKEE